jgi:hypothetical protein
MQLKKASRKQVKLRLNLASPSGFGKTYGALLIAYGITGKWETISVIDTEHDSASLYAHLGNFNTISLDSPFTAERYIEAIGICEDAAMEVIIIDSITHVWSGEGGILAYQNALGGRYQDWAKATPLYQKWLNTILKSKCHVITTNRKKQGYNMITVSNKTKVEKAGLEDEIRSGYEYEMSLSLEIINENHLAKASKDRTGLFANKPEFIISVNTGKRILDWCNEGHVEDVNTVFERINDCKSIEELLQLYYLHPVEDEVTKTAFSQKRTELEQSLIPASLLNFKTQQSNGKLH